MRTSASPESVFRAALRRAVGKEMPTVTFAIQRTENPAHGDYATNIAMRLAPARRMMPIVVAEEIAAKLRADVSFCRVFDSLRVAPPGFLNATLLPAWLAQQIPHIVAADKSYGHLPSAIRHKPKIQVEFISANPTGPLTLANGRGGFLGDALANVLAASGADVTREYYVNDSGEQVKKLGWSVLKAS